MAAFTHILMEYPDFDILHITLKLKLELNDVIVKITHPYFDGIILSTELIMSEHFFSNGKNQMKL